jgi:hypothetical protein
VVNEPPKWWLADVDSPAPEGPVPAVGHEDCHHRVYRLTCRQYDRLLALTAGRCQICGLRDHENFRDRLYLDHVHKLGIWAVRGLLCRPCNARLRSPWTDPKTVSYGENAYYLTLLIEAGFDTIVPAEPAEMTVLVDHSLRPWRREPEGWWPLKAHPSTPIMPVTWPRLVYMFGAHNLRPARLDVEAPLMAPLHRQRLAQVHGIYLPTFEGVSA